MKKNPLVYINHVLDAILCVEQFVDGVSKEDFFKDRMRYDAT